MTDTAARWARIAAARTQDVSLAEGALLIAAEEYQDLDVDDYLSERLKTVVKDIELDPAIVAGMLTEAAPNDIFARSHSPALTRSNS